MKRWWWLWAGLALSAVLVALALRGTPEGDVRTIVQEASSATEAGVNRRDLSAVEPFFATPAEGANLAGLGQTIGQLRMFTTHLSPSDQVQVHSFQIQSVAVHESGGLARATYRLHVSVVRGGAAVYTAVMTQNLALLKTPRGWRISGGDQPQLSDVVGAWPPR
ncbi:MAG TPA: hypothetical protein VF909_05695 [Roseiflexaceae bacterium]